MIDLKTAKYVSPSGAEVTFAYEDLELSVSKKIATFNFPRTNATYIQDLGSNMREIPLTAIIHGAGYDFSADTFQNVLLERGIGTLHHPMYGIIYVVLSSLNRKDNIVSSEGQVIFELVFSETIKTPYPETISDPISALNERATIVLDATVVTFFEASKLDTVAQKQTFLTRVKAALDNIKNRIKYLSAAQADIQRAVEDAIADINNNIDVLVGQPIAMAYRMIELITLPSRVLTQLEHKFEAYGNLIGGLLDNNRTISNSIERNQRTEDINSFVFDDLQASTAIVAMSTAFVDSDQTSVSSANGYYSEIEAWYFRYIEWRDYYGTELSLATATTSNIELLDTSSSYMSIAELIGIIGRYTALVIPRLKKQVTIELNSDTNIIPLCAKLYGDISYPILDLLMETNNISVNESMLIKAGREIVYYV